MVSLIRKIIIPVFIIIWFISCKEKIFTGNVNCDECFVDKPDSVYLTIHFTQNEQFPEVPVLLFKGNIDSGKLIDTFYCYVDSLGIEYNQVYVEAEEEYSAKAIYETNERTVYVVDGTKQKLKYVSETCEETCWVSEDDQLFLELVY
jgi:hypothetical protein